MALNEKFFNSPTGGCAVQPDQNELVFHIDAADSNSLNAGGAGTLQDLSGNGKDFNHIRLVENAEGSLSFNTSTSNSYAYNFTNMQSSFGTGSGNYNWSLVMWVNTNTIGTGLGSLYEQGGFSDGSNNGFKVYRSGSSLQVEGKANESTARRLVDVSGAFTANAWVHIVVQRTDTVWEAYVDGVLQTNTGAYKSNSTYLTDDLGGSDATDSNTIIGRQYQAVTHEWEGKMSDIKLYDIALSQCEVDYEFSIKQFAIPPVITVDFLTVAGGGGGSSGYGGSPQSGGGAGGFRTSFGSDSGGGTSAMNALQFGLDTNYVVSIGAGGAGALNNGGTVAGNGTSSYITGLTTTVGGGGSISWSSTSTPATGGSGAGQSYKGESGGPGQGTSGEGFAGGVPTVDGPGGGGGGAASAGSWNNTDKGVGGTGIDSLITGTSAGFAGGGGRINSHGGGLSKNFATHGLSRGGNGVSGTGGGGGGGYGTGTQPTPYTGGNGGSGFIYLRYPAEYTFVKVTSFYTPQVNVVCADDSDFKFVGIQGDGTFKFTL